MATFWSRFRSWFGRSGLDQGDGAQSPSPGSYGYASAKSVTLDTALELSAVWACARILSETLASLPLMLYVKSGDSREVVRDDQLYTILHDRPNSRQTAMEFRETMQLNLVLTGNAYARIQRRDDNDPRSPVVALWPIPSSQITPDVLEDGSVVYLHKSTSGGRIDMRVYAQERILHIKLFGNGIIGLSPIGYARNTLGLGIALDESATTFYANGGKPSGVLMIDQVLKPEQREALRRNFVEMRDGQNDRLFVLEASMKYEQLSISPEDAELLNSRRFQVEDIARWFGVPSFLINDTSKTTTWGSGIEQMMLGFYTLSLRPYFERWEASINTWLLTPAQRAQGMYAEFNLDALLRADSAGRAEYYSKMVQNGLMSRNEARSKENLPQRAGADELTAQTNLAPLHLLGKVKPTPTPRGDE